MQINNIDRTKLYISNFGVNNMNRSFSPVAFGGGTDVFVKSAVSQVNDVYKFAAEKLVGIFSQKAAEMPKGLNYTFSQANGSLLTYSKELGDNVVVRAIKKVAEDKKKNFLYVVFKEFKAGELKDIFALDIKTGELIKLKPDGKLSIIKNDFVKYQPNTADSKYKKHMKKIQEYAGAIFPEEDFKPKVVEVAEKQIKEDFGRYIMPDKMKKDVAEINDIMMRYSDLIAACRGYSSDIVKWKEQYEPLIYTSKKQKNTMFKFRNLEALSILHSRSNQRFTRIVHTNSSGIETHYLIDGGDKVVANLNKKRPWLIPEKYRYMTTEQVENSEIGSYIEFLKTQLRDYYSYIETNLHDVKLLRRNKVFKSQSELAEYVDEMSKKIEADMGAIRGEMEKHADKAASELVAQYFRILSEKLGKYTNESLPEFKADFHAFLNKFLLPVEKSDI